VENQRGLIPLIIRKVMQTFKNKKFTLSDISLGSASGEDEADFLDNFSDYFYDHENISKKIMEKIYFF
jgi:hypothetical protein